MAGTQSTVPFYGLQGQQVAREPIDKRPGGAVKDPMATRNCPVELVAVPALSRLDLASVALHHSRVDGRVHGERPWSADAPCFDWCFHLQTYAGCSQPLVSSEKHLVALSRGTS